MALFILLFYLVAVVWGSPYTNSSQNLLQARVTIPHPTACCAYLLCGHVLRFLCCRGGNG